MTWEQLAEKIAQMTEQERRGAVKFMEPYENFKIIPVCLELASETIKDEDGDRVAQGEWFLR